jgi:hypothetical protein
MLYMQEVNNNNNNNTNSLDRARIEKENFSNVDSKDHGDDIIAMANTETQEYTNVSEQKNWQIEEKLSAVFEEAKSKLDSIDIRAKNEKKQVIVQLAKDLEGKVPTHTISIEIVNQLRGRVSERFIHECLDEKYKQKYRAENARKRRNKEEEKGNQENNLAALPLLNRETKRKIMTIIDKLMTIIDKQGGLEVVDDEKSQNQQASDNVVRDAHITSAKARYLQLAVKQERENSQPEDLVKPNYQENQDIKFDRDETKCSEQINQQDNQEWSKTKIFELKGNAIPLKITVNSVKREIVSIEIDFECIKNKKKECRERYQQYQYQQ